VDYAMVVNLSLRESARLFIETQKGYGSRHAVSPASGDLIALDAANSLQLDEGSKRRMAPGGEEYRNGLWLAAGQGLLLKFEE
jgi:hypothetical protein